MDRTLSVSTIIPTYNRAEQTIAAIESVLGQTFPSYEIIVVDDGSTDGSTEIIAKYIDKKANPENRLQLIRQANQGPGVARNTGIDAATGDYIAFLDSDDIWMKGKLELQVEALGKLGPHCGAIFTDARMVNGAGMNVSSFELHERHYSAEIGLDPSLNLSLAQTPSGLWISSLLVRTDIVRGCGGIDPTIRFAEDWDLHFRLSMATAVGYVNVLLIQSDRTPSHPGSTCRPWDDLEVQFVGQQRMFEKWLQINSLTPAVRAVVRRSLGNLHSHRTNWYLEHEQYSEARMAVRDAVKHKLAPGIAAKWALISIAPTLAKKISPRTRPIGSLGHAS